MKASNKLLIFGGLSFVTLILLLAILTCTAKNNNERNQGENDQFSFFKERILGNQKIVTKDYALATLTFSKINLNVSGDVVIQVADQPNTAKTTVTCDANILPYIKVYTQNDTLFVTRDTNVRLAPSRRITININANGCAILLTHGATNVLVNNLKRDNFYAELNGTGNSKFYGDVSNFVVAVNGASDVDAHHLKAENVKVKIKGAGEVLTYATKSIDIDISGAGSVGYYGNPKDITRSLHGFGVIKALNDKAIRK